MATPAAKRWTRWERWPTAWRDAVERRRQSEQDAEAALSAHLDVAARYGVKFANYERDGRMRLCYEGDAFRRVLAMRSTPEQRARAVLGLTRAECVNPGLRVTERYQADELRAEVLDRVDAAALPGYLKNRVLMRRASVWSAIAYQHTRKNLPSDAAANRALTELGGINKAELTDDDLAVYADAAMRASASRWAVLPVPSRAKARATSSSPSRARPARLASRLSMRSATSKIRWSDAALMASCGRTPRR